MSSAPAEVTMMRNVRFIRAAVVCAIALFLLLGPVAGQERDRSQIPTQDKWDLTPLYPSDDAWRQAKDRLATELPKLAQFQGKLASSSTTLLAALDAMSSAGKDLGRLYLYASLSADEDTRDSKHAAMRQEMTQLAAAFSADVAYVEPEILRADKEKITSFVRERPGLKPYQHELDDILRRQAHTGTEGEEHIIADAGLMTPAASDIYGMFSDADFPYPTVTLSDGRPVRLTSSGFGLYRALPDRDDRQKVMSSFFTALGNYRRTFGAMMNASVQKDLFYMKARRYGSMLEASLDQNNIPVSVYTSLVDGVNANLSSFQRYLKLRKRMMGVSELHYYDLYAPLVASVNLEYPIEKAKQEILAALEPLGSEYTSVIKRAFSERWIDLYPTPGKRTGAYSDGAAYDVHPYMLLNYNGKYADMSTLAHELGHTMQSYFSNKTQPYPTADYPIFVAEVASTFNEALLIDHVLKGISDPATELSLLGNYLENIKGTLFRQTQFAEFEMRTHQMAEQGQPLTGDALSALYMDITKKYYGHDAGVCTVDDYVAHEWAYIPHFYRTFYVYQYATSFTASAALAERVLAGDPAARQRYLQFLSAGGSKYPIELLKDAGVDMTTAEPLRQTIKRMNQVMDEMEGLLGKLGK
jgi:oligoendopeptidase F